VVTKTPPLVAGGTLSLFDHALRIYHLLEPIFPVFSPIIYVITYSDGLCHPTRGSTFRTPV
jgi:hypothetical protein